MTNFMVTLMTLKFFGLAMVTTPWWLLVLVLGLGVLIEAAMKVYLARRAENRSKTRRKQREPQARH